MSNLPRQSAIAGAFLAVLPGFALASDPTGLFIFYFGAPAAAASLLLVAFAYFLPRTSLVFVISFLGAHIPLMRWAFDVGYMRTAGGWLYFSCVLGIFSLVLAMVRIGRQRKRVRRRHRWVGGA